MQTTPIQSVDKPRKQAVTGVIGRCPFHNVNVEGTFIFISMIAKNDFFHATRRFD